MINGERVEILCEIHSMIRLVLKEISVGRSGTLYLNGGFLFPLNIYSKPMVVRRVRAFTTLVSLLPVGLKACLS